MRKCFFGYWNSSVSMFFHSFMYVPELKPRLYEFGTKLHVEPQWCNAKGAVEKKHAVVTERWHEIFVKLSNQSCHFLRLNFCDMFKFDQPSLMRHENCIRYPVFFKTAIGKQFEFINFMKTNCFLYFSYDHFLDPYHFMNIIFNREIKIEVTSFNNNNTSVWHIYQSS